MADESILAQKPTKPKPKRPDSSHEQAVDDSLGEGFTPWLRVHCRLVALNLRSLSHIHFSHMAYLHTNIHVYIYIYIFIYLFID